MQEDCLFIKRYKRKEEMSIGELLGKFILSLLAILFLIASIVSIQEKYHDSNHDYIQTLEIVYQNGSKEIVKITTPERKNPPYLSDGCIKYYTTTICGVRKVVRIKQEKIPQK